MAFRPLMGIVASHYGNWMWDSSQKKVSDRLLPLPFGCRYIEDELSAKFFSTLSDEWIAVNLALRCRHNLRHLASVSVMRSPDCVAAFKLIQLAEKQVGRLLKRRWHAVMAVAANLAKHGMLTGRQIDDILRSQA